MTFRAIVAVTLVLSAFSTAEAQFGRFGRRSYSQPKTQSTRGGNYRASRVLQMTPEKMTEVFGPSILVRETKPAKQAAAKAQQATTTSARFVTQPTD